MDEDAFLPSPCKHVLWVVVILADQVIAYRQNMNREGPEQSAESSNGGVDQLQDTSRRGVSRTEQSSGILSGGIRTTPQNALGHDQRQQVPLQDTVGNANTDVNRHSNAPYPNLLPEMDLSQTIDDLTWINGLPDDSQDPNLRGSDLVSPLSVMTGALPGPSSWFANLQNDSTVNGSSDPEFISHENYMNSAALNGPSQRDQSARNQEYNAIEDKPVYAPAANGDDNRNLYIQHTSLGGVDCVMEVDEPTGTPVSQENGLSAAPIPTNSTALGKRPAKMPTPNPQARRNALRQIKRLTSEAVELLSKIEALHTENRGLHAKLGQTESEKQKLLLTLRQIQGEIDVWEFDDEEVSDLQDRIDMLNQSMQKTRQLLPP